MNGCAKRARISRSRTKRWRSRGSARPGRSSFSATLRSYSPSARNANQTWSDPALAEQPVEAVAPMRAPGRAPAGRATTGSARKPASSASSASRRPSSAARSGSSRCSAARCSSRCPGGNRAGRRAGATAAASARCPSRLTGRPTFGQAAGDSCSDASRNIRALCQSRRTLRLIVQQGGDLQFRQAREIAHLHHLREALVDRGQPVQRGVQSQHVSSRRSPPRCPLRQVGDAMQVAAALLRQALAGVVDDHRCASPRRRRRRSARSSNCAAPVPRPISLR